MIADDDHGRKITAMRVGGWEQNFVTLIAAWEERNCCSSWMCPAQYQ